MILLRLCLGLHFDPNISTYIVHKHTDKHSPNQLTPNTANKEPHRISKVSNMMFLLSSVL